MKTAQPHDAILVLSSGSLPDGIGYIEVQCPCYYESPKAFAARPKALVYEGRAYGWSGWDSDRRVSFYRTDRALAYRVTS